ncbi:hypothetical protein [Pseudomonas baltica]|nr:hypothetical protein [Pseudomonas baltica]
MELVLKQIASQIDVTTMKDPEPRFIPGETDKQSPFALYTDSGEMLPCQVSTALVSDAGGFAQLTVVFTVDGDNLRVQGHGL